MHAKIMGRMWQIRFVNARDLPKNTRGLCDPPKKAGKSLRILRRQSATDELDTLIHEMLHAAGWHIDEQFVEQFATDAARTLIRLGWRRADGCD